MFKLIAGATEILLCWFTQSCVTDDRLTVQFLRIGPYPFKRSFVLNSRFLVQFIPRQFRLVPKQEADLMCKLEALRLFYKHPIYKAVLAEDYFNWGNNSEFGADILLLSRKTGNHMHSLEVEIKYNWVGDFSFPDIQFVPRKREKWDDPDFSYGTPVHWMLFSSDLSQYLIVYHNDIMALDQTRSVYCRGRGREDVYTISLEKARFNCL